MAKRLQGGYQPDDMGDVKITPPKSSTGAVKPKKKPGRPPKKKATLQKQKEILEDVLKQRSCGWCKYWQRDNQYPSKKLGKCHRYPIMPDEHKDHFDWCGEFKKNDYLSPHS